MGSSQSFQKHETITPPSCNGNRRLGSLGELPESCVAMVLMNLEPTEICKLAGLNRAFRGAASADFVWEKKLPGNYQRLIERVFDERNDNGKNMCKRDVYALLCGCNSIDDGTKQVWLDVNTGGMCLAISAKGLTITGIDDRRYWNHIPSDESRFSTVAYLQQIWWFEVIGEVEFPFPAGTYSVFFRLQSGRTFKWFGRRQCNTEHVHGWDKKPVHFLLSTSDGQKAVSQCFIKEPGKWINYHVGNFVVKNSYEIMKLKFSMTQIDCTHTKGGLCVDSVMIYPKTFTERLKQF
ncbi:F-box protein PP2-A12-like protein [Drosera capensis]